MIFDRLFKGSKKNAPSWKDLSEEQRHQVTQKLMKRVSALAGARYKIVSGFDMTQREAGITETEGEDEILPHYARGRLLDMTRNAVRNSSTLNTILKQLDFNVVGVNGGKAILDFPNIEASKELVKKFSRFTRSADFFDGYSFNQVLKLILKNAIIGGDCVVMFDDGLVEDSGKLLIYESDEIGSTTDEAIQARYGQNAHQSQGKVYNANGRWIGTVVSRSQRGADVFDPDKCFFLRRDPDASPFDALWIQPSNVWRTSQGRGVSQAASSIGTIIDLEDLCGFELQAAKKNAQTFAQIYKTVADKDEVAIPSAFDQDTDFSQMTDEQIEEAAKEESKQEERVVSFQKAMSAGIIYEAMPDDYKMELLDTKHPNQNMPEFIKWLAGRSSAVFGLSEAFATLMPSGADFRAQQLLTQPAFLEAQKFLEQICDWVLYRYVKWMSKRGEFDESTLPEDWMEYAAWDWPKMDELDEGAHQEAIRKALLNGTKTYKEILGNSWRETLLQTQAEVEFFKEHGLAHPSYNMISGGERTGADDFTTDNDNEEIEK